MSTMHTVRSGRPLLARDQSMSPPASLFSSLGAVLAWLEDKLERRRGRRALLEMPDGQLKDIGLSRADAFNEARRRFWD